MNSTKLGLAGVQLSIVGLFLPWWNQGIVGMILVLVGTALVGLAVLPDREGVRPRRRP